MNPFPIVTCNAMSGFSLTAAATRDMRFANNVGVMES